VVAPVFFKEHNSFNCVSYLDIFRKAKQRLR